MCHEWVEVGPTNLQLDPTFCLLVLVVASCAQGTLVAAVSWIRYMTELVETATVVKQHSMQQYGPHHSPCIQLLQPLRAACCCWRLPATSTRLQSAIQPLCCHHASHYCWTTPRAVLEAAVNHRLHCNTAAAGQATPTSPAMLWQGGEASQHAPLA
jgi:hypothetical protein